MFRSAIAILLVGTAAACSNPQGIACTEEARSIMNIAVVDSISGAAITQGLSGTVTDGTFTTKMMNFSANFLTPDAYERPGTYNVTVTVTGYKTWQKNGVVVTKTSDGCHVQTVQLTAKLQK